MITPSISPDTVLASNATRCHNVAGYVAQYKGLSEKLGKNIVDLALVVFEAETNLRSSDYDAFCAEVKIAKRKSFHKKLRTIGKNATRFAGHLNELPNNWTTIYKLAQMDYNKFNAFVNEERLHQNLKAREIDAFLQKPPKNRTHKVYVTLNGADPDTERAIFRALKDCLQKFGDKARIVLSDPDLQVPATASDEDDN